MLRELATETGAQVWAIASMVFFLLAFLVVAVRVWRAEPADVKTCAHLPLASDEGIGPGAETANPQRADSPDKV